MNTEKKLTPEDLIHKYIGRMFQSLEAASIKYFLETGTINGSFRVNLIEILNLYGQQEETIGYERGKKEANEWISIKDRLPEKGEHVLCSFQTLSMDMRRYVSESVCFNTDFVRPGFSGEHSTAKVTHWMPLPAPPQQGKEETKA